MTAMPVSAAPTAAAASVRRLAAHGIDVVFAAVLSGLVGGVLAAVGGPVSVAAAVALAYWIACVVWLCVGGRTPGHAILGMRMQQRGGSGAPGVRGLSWYALMTLLAGLTAWIVPAVLLLMTDASGRCWPDRLCGVIVTRVGGGSTTELPASAGSAPAPVAAPWNQLGGAGQAVPSPYGGQQPVAQETAGAVPGVGGQAPVWGEAPAPAPVPEVQSAEAGAPVASAWGEAPAPGPVWGAAPAAASEVQSAEAGAPVASAWGGAPAPGPVWGGAPAPVSEVQPAEAPAPAWGAAPAPACGEAQAPAPAWGETPAPAPVWGEAPAPVSEVQSAEASAPAWGAAPAAAWGEVPAPAPGVQPGEAPAAAPAWGETPAPVPAPVWGEAQAPAPAWGAASAPAPEVQPAEAPAPAPMWGEAPAPSPVWGETPAPAPVSEVQPAEAGAPVASSWGETPAPSPVWGEAPAPAAAWGEASAPVSEVQPAEAGAPVASAWGAAATPAPAVAPVITSVPGVSQPAAAVPQAAEPATAAAPVQPSRSEAPSDIDERTVVRVRASHVAHGPLTLVSDTQQVIELPQGRAVLGRSPEPQGTWAGATAIVVTDVSMSVSKSHLGLLLDGENLYACDMDSTNGSEIELGNGSRMPLAAGQLVAVPEGASIRLGDRVLHVAR